jgi:UDP-glucose 4-epimerase
MMNTDLTGSTVLITGGTGTFGTTLADRLLATGCAQVRVLSRDEAKQDDMRRRFADSRLRFYLGNVRDADTLTLACRDVDYVFHAAALKQVPSCEFFPWEAVRTNVLGSLNVLEAARVNRVRTVVCLSTDKAVYPINAMGMSKALMEKVAQAYARDRLSGDTVVCTVRYGNVIFSRGSVIPLFVDLIKHGAPLTITDPRMTRFLMSVDDAIDLVEHAFTTAEPGDLFVRKAPAATVEVIARAVSNVFGLTPEIQIIGVRHAEKMAETLVSREEMVRAEDQGEYFRVPVDDRSLNYGLYVEVGQERVMPARQYTSDTAEQLDEGAVAKILLEQPAIQTELAAYSMRALETVG